MKREYIEGWCFLALGALIFLATSQLYEIGDKHPIEAAVLAIIAGITLGSFGLIPSVCSAGIKAFEKPLILGIVLLGSSFDLSLFQSQGFRLLLIIGGTMGLGLAAIYLLSRYLNLDSRLAILLAVGTTICGGTAIAVVAPLIQAKEEETSYAIAVIALFGLLAILIYPFVAALIPVSDESFGLFAGTAIHSTPQVVAAGYIYSEEAGATATAVKLVRNCLLAPVALGIAMYWNKSRVESTSATASADVVRAFPWFLFAYFIVAAVCGLATVPDSVLHWLGKSGKFFVLMGLFGVGLNSKISSIRSLGPKPLIVGLLASLLVALLSGSLIVFTSL